MSNTNTSKLWQRLQFEDVLFSDQKPGEASPAVSSTALSKSIKPIEKTLTSVQNEVKELKQQNAMLLDQLALMRSTMNKVISNTLIDKNDWDKIRKALKSAWAHDKFLTANKITEIIAEAIALDQENEDNQQIFKLAVDKAKDYLRCTLYKTFVEHVSFAVNDYFRDNATIEEEDIPEHVSRIMRIGKWIKTNPTDADKKLAKSLIKELIKDRLQNPLNEPPRKKRKIERTYPRPSPVESDNDEKESSQEEEKDNEEQNKLQSVVESPFDGKKQSKGTTKTQQSN